MPVNRSPNYPRISLKNAIDKVRRLWDKEGRSRLQLDGMSAVLGYASYNGSAQTVISALRKYGLLTGKGDELMVSDDAVAILHAERGSRERAEALHRCALGPELFEELRREFPTSLPSEENLRYRLIRKGYTQEAAARAARNYRETWELVSAEAGGYNLTVADDPAPDEEEEPMPAEASVGRASGAVPAAPPPPSSALAPSSAHSVAPSAGPGVLWLQVPFRGASLSVRIEASGQVLTKEHVARVRKYLHLAEMDLDGEGGSVDGEE